MIYPDKLTIRDVELKNKRALVRVDFNVPCKDGKIGDDTRIVSSLPTIQYLLDRGASVIIMSHMGRPKNGYEEKNSLAVVSQRVSQLLARPVMFAKDCVGEETRKMAHSMQPGQIMMLENLRFHPEETANDAAFAKQLADLGDLYVNDAFGSTHRAHASVVGIADYLPAVCGLLIEKEITFLGRAVNEPRRPFVLIMGGSKVSDKITLIENLLTKVDKLLIGGGMANTFLASQGHDLKASLMETNKTELTTRFLQGKYAEKIFLPIDVVAASECSETAEYITCGLDEIPDGWMVLDVGPKTIELYSRQLWDAATVVWNGPLGVFELEPFSAGTIAIAREVADCRAFSIIGGGDSVSAVNKAGEAYRIDHVSTGGGATLEFLQGMELPGISVLLNKVSAHKEAVNN